MGLIGIPGLNCYESCVINIANRLNIDFPLSFWALWSETEFIYHDRFDIFATGRMPQSLEALGLTIEEAVCGVQDQAAAFFNAIASGTFIIIGLDAFYLPWSPIYNMSHDAHYFFAQIDGGDTLSCCDPAYGEACVCLPRQVAVSRAFELYRAAPVKRRLFIADVRAEAERVVVAHPGLKTKLLRQMDDAEHLRMLGKYIGALINNRYLYRHYLKLMHPDIVAFFHDGFFREWMGVRNGLFKASLLKKKEKTMEQVKDSFRRLMDSELDLAKRIMAHTNHPARR